MTILLGVFFVFMWFFSILSWLSLSVSEIDCLDSELPVVCRVGH